MELFEKIRREYEHGIGTIIGVASDLGVHRRMIRQALVSSVPPDRKIAVRDKPKLSLVMDFVDEILEADKSVRRKQRHTAHKIWDRITKEKNVSICESVVRAFVRKRKQEMGLKGQAVTIPQIYSPGQEAQVDWFEADVKFHGVLTTIQFFCMRSMYSGGAFHRAYLSSTQQAFLDAHEHGFRHFGGVFRELRYDNLTSAVKKVFRGRQRDETDRFIAFRSHWDFKADFCTPGQGNEKGGVEGEGGYFRRNFLVPVPEIENLEALNALMVAGCRQEEERVIGDRSEKVGKLMVAELSHLLPSAEEDFDLAELSDPIVDGFGCVTVKKNRYSTPLLPGMKASARTMAGIITVFSGGRCVASHERLYGHGEMVLSLEHYLDVLDRKPGALAGSRTLAQYREAGLWPEIYDRWWAIQRDRLGLSEGTRRMIEVVRQVSTHGSDRVRLAVEQALALGSRDTATVIHLLRNEDSATPLSLPIEDLGSLACYEYGPPAVDLYDSLLNQEAH